VLFATFFSVSSKERVQLHGVWVACFDWFFFYLHFFSSLCTYFFLLFHTADSFFVAHTTRFSACNCCAPGWLLGAGVQLAGLLFVRIINYHPLLGYPGNKKKILGVGLILEIETEPDARVRFAVFHVYSLRQISFPSVCTKAARCKFSFALRPRLVPRNYKGRMKEVVDFLLSLCPAHAPL